MCNAYKSVFWSLMYQDSGSSWARIMILAVFTYCEETVWWHSSSLIQWKVTHTAAAYAKVNNVRAHQIDMPHSILLLCER